MKRPPVAPRFTPHTFVLALEIHHGKPIFYGLGHFAFDMPGMEGLDPSQIQKWREVGDYVIYPRDGYPLLPFHPETRMSMIAACEFEGSSISRIGFIPCLINPSNQPLPLAVDSAEEGHFLKYMRDITSEVGLSTCYGRARFQVGSHRAVLAE